MRSDPLKLRPKEPLEIALYDLDFSWRSSEIVEVIEMWNGGKSIDAIAAKVRPPRKGIKTKADAEDETALLIMHLMRQGKIKQRPGGMFGGE